jgi:hypothetical protein
MAMSSSDAFRVMEDFIKTISDKLTRNRFTDAISYKKPFSTLTICYTIILCSGSIGLLTNGKIYRFCKRADIVFTCLQVPLPGKNPPPGKRPHLTVYL